MLPDPRRILENSKVYSWFRQFAAGDHEREVFAQEYVKANANDRILDVGCGPCDLLEDLPPSVGYVGTDTAPKYIQQAQERFGKRGTFLCQLLDDALVDQLGPHSFDIAIAHGLLHHINDEQVRDLYRVVTRALKPGGRLVTLDGCYTDSQPLVVKALLKADRGRHVRNLEGYLKLTKDSFEDVSWSLRTDLHRIPYTVLIQTCTTQAVR